MRTSAVAFAVALVCSCLNFSGSTVRGQPLSPGGTNVASFRVEGAFTPPGEPQAADAERAIAVALRKAMSQGCERLRPDPALNRKIPAGLEAMDVQALKPFFSSITILRERKRPGYCDVQLDATVDLDKLKEWLGKLSSDHPLKKKRFMIVIPEHHLANPIPDPAGETEMIRTFLADGLRLVDQKQIETIRGKDSVKRAMKGDSKELIAIAQGFGADILVVGEAFSQDVPRNPRIDGNLFPCRARIEARVIMCDTGEILAASDAEGSAQDIAPAVAAKAAIRTASKKLSDRLLNTLLVESDPNKPCKLILAGADFEQKVDFKNLLKSMTATVTEVDEVSFQESRAEFDIHAKVPSGKLAEEIYSQAKEKGIKLKVLEQSNGRLVMEIVK